jgi:hypothetical protein
MQASYAGAGLRVIRIPRDGLGGVEDEALPAAPRGQQGRRKRKGREACTVQEWIMVPRAPSPVRSGYQSATAFLVSALVLVALLRACRMAKRLLDVRAWM